MADVTSSLIGISINAINSWPAAAIRFPGCSGVGDRATRFGTDKNDMVSSLDSGLYSRKHKPQSEAFCPPGVLPGTPRLPIHSPACASDHTSLTASSRRAWKPACPSETPRSSTEKEPLPHCHHRLPDTRVALGHLLKCLQ